MLSLALPPGRVAQAQSGVPLPPLSQLSGYRLARISPGSPAAVYVDWKSGCPQISDTCVQSGVTMQPGTLVVVRSQRNGLAQAQSPGISGRYVTADRLVAVQTPPKPALSAWDGTWTSAADRLTLTRAAGGALSVGGNAFWYGAQGVVHVGQVNGRSKPVNRTMQVLEGKGRSACGLDLVLLGDLLYVQDNGNCGGMNVSFEGFYRRGAAHPATTRKVRIER